MGLSRPLVLGSARVPLSGRWLIMPGRPIGPGKARHSCRAGPGLIKIVPGWARSGLKSRAMGQPTGLEPECVTTSLFFAGDHGGVFFSPGALLISQVVEVE